MTFDEVRNLLHMGNLCFNHQSAVALFMLNPLLQFPHVGHRRQNRRRVYPELFTPANSVPEKIDYATEPRTFSGRPWSRQPGAVIFDT